MNCIHKSVKRYRIKGTNKIRWVCEDCGNSGIIQLFPKKVQQSASNEQNRVFPRITGEQFNRPSIQGQGIGYKGISENLQSGMKDLNQGMQNIPHLVIGKDKQNSSTKIFSDKEEKTIGKIRNWGLVIAVCVVVGYAGYRIIGVIF